MQVAAIPTITAAKPMAAAAPAPTLSPAPANPGTAGAAATPKPADASAPAADAAAGAAPQPASGGGKPPADPAAAQAAEQAAALQKMLDTSAPDALTAISGHLDKLETLTVGGNTPEGTENAKLAVAMLTDASMLMQHAHVKAMQTPDAITPELYMKMMGAASGMAFLGGQVALASGSKEALPLAKLAEQPFAQTREAIADVLAALQPAEGSGTGAATDAAAPAPVGATEGAPDAATPAAEPAPAAAAASAPAAAPAQG